MKASKAPANAQSVKEYLQRFQAVHVNTIKHDLGLSHESVYTALVWLEAQGMAVIRCSATPTRADYREWEAM